jgi:hypothetical protein
MCFHQKKRSMYTGNLLGTASDFSQYVHIEHSLLPAMCLADIDLFPNSLLMSFHPKKCSMCTNFLLGMVSGFALYARTGRNL